MATGGVEPQGLAGVGVDPDYADLEVRGVARVGADQEDRAAVRDADPDRAKVGLDAFDAPLETAIGGELSIRRGPKWTFDQLPLAHQAMDENRANGKMVVVVD